MARASRSARPATVASLPDLRPGTGRNVSVRRDRRGITGPVDARADSSGARRQVPRAWAPAVQRPGSIPSVPAGRRVRSCVPGGTPAGAVIWRCSPPEVFGVLGQPGSTAQGRGTFSALTAEPVDLGKVGPPTTILLVDLEPSGAVSVPSTAHGDVPDPSTSRPTQRSGGRRRSGVVTVGVVDGAHVSCSSGAPSAPFSGGLHQR